MTVNGRWNDSFDLNEIRTSVIMVASNVPIDQLCLSVSVRTFLHMVEPDYIQRLKRYRPHYRSCLLRLDAFGNAFHRRVACALSFSPLCVRS